MHFTALGWFLSLKWEEKINKIRELEHAISKLQVKDGLEKLINNKKTRYRNKFESRCPNAVKNSLFNLKKFILIRNRN